MTPPSTTSTSPKGGMVLIMEYKKIIADQPMIIYKICDILSNFLTDIAFNVTPNTQHATFIPHTVQPAQPLIIERQMGV